MSSTSKNAGKFIGSSHELAETLKKSRVDIVCVQETKWKGVKARDTGDGYKLKYDAQHLGATELESSSATATVTSSRCSTFFRPPHVY
ncbi:hypothetical protein Y032_0032g2586 [Ancylostoma ceylanicum]|uniref:Endonuclease/exonuclease/phosphatase domain-containing protein n=1 Tax=Ancylostoma ceylanicum TaxID=53326 RepID=A0A016UPZ8_9BILA|nr:hypothetical protein Y032_0032g2586 [Ancylostoma ceylanicum]